MQKYILAFLIGYSFQVMGTLALYISSKLNMIILLVLIATFATHKIPFLGYMFGVLVGAVVCLLILH